jgi:hypothetical protein
MQFLIKIKNVTFYKRATMHYKQLLYQLEHNISPLQAFKEYKGSELIQSSQLSIITPIQTLWKSKHKKLEIRMWLPDYIHTKPFSGYTKSYIHTRLLYGRASMSVMNEKDHMYSHYPLCTLTNCFTIQPYSDFICSPTGEYTVGLFLYEKIE